MYALFKWTRRQIGLAGVNWSQEPLVETNMGTFVNKVMTYQVPDSSANVKSSWKGLDTACRHKTLSSHQVRAVRCRKLARSQIARASRR